MLVTSQQKLIILVMIALLSTVSWADESDLTQRVDRLERIIQGQGLMNLIVRVEQLQSEVQRLNGENEALRHQLKQMKESQRQMYIDLDERLKKAHAKTTGPVAGSENAPQPAGNEVTGNTGGAEQTSVSGTDSVPVAVESGEAAYQSALQTLRSGQYEQAAKALASFPEQYPDSIYVPNAYYWQGEAKYVMRQFADAAALFQIVIDQYPASSKVADALLKRGFSEYELGEIARGKQSLNTVIEKYPDSTAARLAKARLARAD